MSCPACGDSVAPDALDSHIKYIHSEVVCTCGTRMEIQLLPFHKTRYECPAMGSVNCVDCNTTMCVRSFDEEKFRGNEWGGHCNRCNKDVQCGGLQVFSDSLIAYFPIS